MTEQPPTRAVIITDAKKLVMEGEVLAKFDTDFSLIVLPYTQELSRKAIRKNRKLIEQAEVLVIGIAEVLRDGADLLAHPLVEYILSINDTAEIIDLGDLDFRFSAQTLRDNVQAILLGLPSNETS